MSTPRPASNEAPSLREKASALVRQHGRDATSFQTLEHGFEYFFDGDDAFVAYRDTGSAWVAAGAPVGPEDRVAEVAERFVEEAGQSARHACFFAVPEAPFGAGPFHLTPIGQEPSWDPQQWPATLRAHRRLREQLRRARKKGVAARIPSREELSPSSDLRRALDGVAAHWLQSRRMSPMAFLVQVDPFARMHERIYVVAERNERLVAALVAVPIFARGGWLVEHAFRELDAPNGTTEVLIDHLMRHVAEQGCRHVSLGLAPLSGPLPRMLRVARRLGGTLYNFEGLHAFKSRLHPQQWQQAYVARPRRKSVTRAFLAVLSAFTPRGLAAFALSTVQHLERPLLRALCALLVPWTALLAVAASDWFPSSEVKWSWVLLDVLLIGLMGGYLRRGTRRLLKVLVALVGADTALTLTQAVLYNAPRAHGPLDWAVILIACSAPCAAFGLLWLFLARPASREDRSADPEINRALPGPPDRSDIPRPR